MKNNSLLKHPNDYYHDNSQECIRHYYEGRLIVVGRSTIELRANVTRIMNRFLFLRRVLNSNSFSHHRGVYD